MKIRNVRSSDYNLISPLINEWWGGRNMADMLPRLFFIHFQESSFLAEKDGRIVGFLIGFLSQTHPEEAYIHFVGVHPNYRKNNIAKELYHEFFRVTANNGRKIVRAVTSPVNSTSITYHTKMGFEMEKGNSDTEGASFFKDYDGPGQDRVLFTKKLV